MQFQVLKVGLALALIGGIIGVQSGSQAAKAAAFKPVICGPAAFESAATSKVIKVADESGLSDAEIAYLYIQANLFEVETAELGVARGTAADVKSHGEMVARDHKGVVRAFEELIQMNGIKPVSTDAAVNAEKQHSAVMEKLKSKQGAEFDKAYLQHEAGNHRAVINALKTVLIPAAKNEAVVKHMQAMLPAFEHHLAVTLKAAKKAGVKVSG